MTSSNLHATQSDSTRDGGPESFCFVSIACFDVIAPFNVTMAFEATTSWSLYREPDGAWHRAGPSSEPSETPVLVTGSRFATDEASDFDAHNPLCFHFARG